VVLARRAARQHDAESLGLAAKLLEQNPEVYTVWNFRREALESILKVLWALAATES
jgi:geranylgeranyl transferase type-2 subunit alpha